MTDSTTILNTKFKNEPDFGLRCCNRCGSHMKPSDDTCWSCGDKPYSEWRWEKRERLRTWRYNHDTRYRDAVDAEKAHRSKIEDDNNAVMLPCMLISIIICIFALWPESGNFILAFLALTGGTLIGSIIGAIVAAPFTK